MQRQLEPSLLDSQRTKIPAGGMYSYNYGFRADDRRRPRNVSVSNAGLATIVRSVLLRFVWEIPGRAIIARGFPISIGNSHRL